MNNKPAELQLVGRTGDGSATELTDVSGAKFSLPIISCEEFANFTLIIGESCNKGIL